MLSVAFFTLFERKVLASIQRRRGPNTVGIFGLFQPIADGIKLLIKETIVPFSANEFIFLIAPSVTFLLALFAWSVIPFNYNVILADINFSVFFIFVVSTLGVYSIIMSGWASNSKYAFLGALRSSAQLISYEIFMLLTILPVFLDAGSLNFIKIVYSQEFCFNFFIFLPLFFLCFIALLAETNRVPFDLPEAESELVSGYNVEYSAVGFVFFFLAEYSNIIVMSCFITILFFGGWLPIFSFLDFLPSFFWFSFKVLFFIFVFVWVRSTLPRFRYDMLMSYCWKIFMPLAFTLFLFYSQAFLYFI